MSSLLFIGMTGPASSCWKWDDFTFMISSVEHNFVEAVMRQAG